MTNRFLLAFPCLAIALIAVLLCLTSRSSHAADIRDEAFDHPAIVARLAGLPTPQYVQIPWRPGRFTEFQMGTPAERGVKARRGDLRGRLYRPPQSGPAPYAILLAGCGDTYTGANILWVKLWARALQDIGVGALTIDSFEARGIKTGVCGNGSRLWAARRVDDIYASLAWLATQPDVDRRRIAVMGMSNGARAALLASSARENARFNRLAATVAIYPTCDRLPPHELMGPALVLLGSGDVEAHPAICEQYVAERQDAIHPPQARVYPDALHLFDVFPRNEDYTRPEVIESRADVLAFLKQALEIPESPARHASQR